MTRSINQTEIKSVTLTYVRLERRDHANRNAFLLKKKHINEPIVSVFISRRQLLSVHLPLEEEMRNSHMKWILILSLGRRLKKERKILRK